MHPETMRKLRVARSTAKVPFVINSAFRTAAHNKKVGGAANSPHLRGRAVDIKAMDGRAKYVILTSLLAAGFHRIGIYRTWIHADDDPSLDPQVVWL